MKSALHQILGTDKALIGMVHVGALPGSPRSRQSIPALAKAAAHEARVLISAGFDAVMIENMHDAPYVNAPHHPAVTATMTAVGLAVADAIGDAPMGVQVLSLGSREALAVALAVGAQFIRVENFAFAHVADEGLMPEAQAGPLLRYRRSIGAQHIAIFADVKKKHASHALTADLPLADAIAGAEFFGADGVIITGAATGRPTDPDDLAEARAATRLPVLVGSGVTPATVQSLFRHADALIVGSSIKRSGHWSQPVDPRRAAAIANAKATPKAR